MASPHRTRIIGAKAVRPERRRYCRERDLPGLIGVWPAEISDPVRGCPSRIVPAIRAALRRERQRGQSGHWAYDINRHMALKQALDEELAGLRRMRLDAQNTARRRRTGQGRRGAQPACGTPCGVSSLPGMATGAANGVKFIGDADRKGDVVA